MVDAAGHNLWYSEDFLGSAGLLRPDEATGYTTVLNSTTSAIDPTCSIKNPVTQTVTISTGVLAWETATYTVDSGVVGFTQYVLPSEFLWGVAAEPTGSYVVDYDRQMLVRLPALPVDVVGCIVEDEDGDLDTTDDRRPLSGQVMILLTDGAPQPSPRLTGEDGYASGWVGLETGPLYGVQQALSDEWKPLTPISHTFGTAVSGASYRHTFVVTPAPELVFLPLLINDQ